MMKLRHILISAILLIPLVSGCTGMQLHDVKPRELPQQASAPSPTTKGPSYLDIADILIPSELSRDASECYMVNGFGRLVVRGRVDGDSIEKFFSSTMPSAGWSRSDEYRFQDNIKMFFMKPDKLASILISENPMDTRVEIWVTQIKQN
jgi:hypothetical protein